MSLFRAQLEKAVLLRQQATSESHNHARRAHGFARFADLGHFR